MDIRVKNAIKRIAAISMGAVMVGTSVMSAVHAATSYTLADFPAPFVAAGKGDFTIVVGQDAKPDDIIGAVDVGVGLQASSSGVSGQAAGVVSGETVKVEEPGNPLNFENPGSTGAETFKDVIGAGLDDSDLPTILADGHYKDSRGVTDNEVDYTQRIDFAANGERLVFDQEDDGSKVLGDYVRVPNNGNFYTYTLDFTDLVDFDVAEYADDLENTQIEIQGKPYIITAVKYDNAGPQITELEMLTGKTIITLTQGDTYTFEDHAIAVTSVTEPDAPQQRCGISVDGVTQFIDEGTDQDFDGLRVGVSDVFAIHGAVGEDACEMTLGSVLTKIVNGGEVQINGEDIGDRDGDPDVTTNALIDTPGNGEWGGFTIAVKSDDELNLGSATDGKDWLDPVFGNFKISYQGLSGNTEHVAFDLSTDDGTFTYTNNEGKTVEIPMFSVKVPSLAPPPANFYPVYLGESYDASMLMESSRAVGAAANIIVAFGGATNCEPGDITGAGYNDLTNGYFKVEDTAIQAADDIDISDMSGTLLYLSTAGQTSRVVEISKIDTDKDEVSFKDVTYGRSSTVKPNDGTVSVDGTTDTYKISGIGEITLAFWDQNAAGNALADCDGTKDLAAVQLVNGNLADTGNYKDYTDWGPDIFTQGYLTQGNNVVVPNEFDGAGDGVDGANTVWFYTLESQDINEVEWDEVDTMIYDTGFPDEELLALEPQSANGWATTATFKDASKTDDKNQYAMTFAGSKWHIALDENDNPKDVDADLAVGEARSGNAFVAETGALFTAPTTGTATGTTTTTAFTGAVARLDTEITDKTATNMILIGGPCVNRLTAELTAQTYPACGTDVATALKVPLDGAQIALYNNAFSGTKVAMTVMGTDATGTRAASEVLKRFAEFKAQLTGMSVNVKSTAGVITVSAPTVA